MTENVQENTARNTPKYRFSLIHIFPYIDTIIEYIDTIIAYIDTIIPYIDTIMPTFGKIQIRESLYLGIFYAVREQQLDSN